MGLGSSRPSANAPQGAQHDLQYAVQNGEYTVVQQQRYAAPRYQQPNVMSGHYPPAPVQNLYPQRQYVQPPQPVPQTQAAPSNFAPPPTRKEAKTIRNDVNLKKHSLKLVKDEHDPRIMYPTFRFDCGAPCSVSVFFLTDEDNGNKLRLRSSVQNPGKRIHYEKQLGCVFPPPGMDKRDLRPYGLRISNYREEQLSKSSSKGRVDTWPLIIRLECVTPEEGLEGHSLDSLPVGSSLPSWVQAQTTYACFEHTEDGYGLKVLKQKIWVNEVAYELQEIYGLENVNKHEKVVAEEDLGTECVICLSEPRDTTLLPCRHMCLCHGCAQMLRTQTNKCPICRTQVQNLLEISVK